MPVLTHSLTEEEYQGLAWFPLLEGTQWSRYRWNAASVLHDQAKVREEAGDKASAEALSLLGGAISMHLSYAAPRPFGPMMQMEGRRTLSIEDLGEHDAALLARVARDTEDPWLRARFGDLAVSCGMETTRRDWQLGKLVVEAYCDYLQQVFMTERAIDGVDECRRALKLFWAYAKTDESLWERYWTLIVAQIQDGLDKRLPGLVYPLCDETMQRNRKLCDDLAQRVETTAKEMSEANSHYEASRYYDYAHRLWRRAGNAEASRRCEAARGEGLVSAALASADGAQALVAGNWMLEGIQALRRARAPAHRIAELREQLTHLQQASLDHFAHFEHGVDVTDVVKHIHDSMKGPTFFEALLQMSFLLATWTRYDSIRKEVLDSAAKYPLSHLFASQHANDKGAIVAVRSPLDTNNEATVIEEMIVHTKKFHMDFRARVLVNHATSILYSNFQPPFHAVKEIVDASPLAPQGFTETLSRGLYAGISDDWVATGAYLIPIAEPFVRAHLERSGVHTKIFHEDGTQEEMNLSSLLDLPRAGEIFGQDLLFELRILLTEPLGYNLRNEYCHGVIEDQGLQSAGVLNLWWLLWRLLMFPWSGSFLKAQTDAHLRPTKQRPAKPGVSSYTNCVSKEKVNYLRPL